MGKFCSKDGGRLEYRELEGEEIPAPAPKASPVPPVPPPQPAPQRAFAGNTVVLVPPVAGPELMLAAADGTSLSIKKTVLLGRETGDFVPQLGRYRTISGEHAQIVLSGEVFSVMDRNSTNGTKLNGELLSPGREYPLKNKDVLELADIQFLVYIK
ncbi:MAG: FHA domain-containing protein [Treponema sp.]|nr:FHA domain-containing protein [Treponema sp.]